MTAEALSAADGPSRVAPHGDAEELAEARQSVVDAVAARFIQVAEPDAAHGPDAPPNGAQANGVHVDAAPPNGMPIDAAQDPVPPEGDAAAVPTDAVPTDAVPTDAVPTDAVPTDAVPTDAVPSGRRADGERAGAGAARGRHRCRACRADCAPRG